MERALDDSTAEPDEAQKSWKFRRYPVLEGVADADTYHQGHQTYFAM